MCQVPGGEEPTLNTEVCPTQPAEQGPFPEGDEQRMTDEPSSTTEKKRSLVQHPVYFVSAVLRATRERYPEI